MDDFEDKTVRRLRGLGAAAKRIEESRTLHLRVEMSEGDFLRAWQDECREWLRLSEDMCDGGLNPSAYDVTQALHRRMEERGDRPLDIPRIWITKKGWLIPR